MIAVTGGAGFIGSHLVAALADQGERVRVIEKPGADCSHLPSGDVAFADITNPASIRSFLADARVVYHLAADPNLWEARRGHFHRVNYRGACNVLDAAVAAGAWRILHCSTESILTRPGGAPPLGDDEPPRLADAIGPYCRSKCRAELHARRLAAAGAPIVIVNPTLPVGPGDRNLSPPTRMMLDFCRGGRSAYIEADLNLIDVRDAALGMIRAVEVGEPGRRYVLGAENWSVRRLFEFLADVLHLPRPRWRVPTAAALAAAYVQEFLADVAIGTSPAATITGVKLARRCMRFDASKSLAALGLRPRPVEQALRDALAWLRETGRISA